MRVLERLREMVGLPAAIVLNNGPEVAGRALEASTHAYQVGLRLIRLASPSRTPVFESVHGKCRGECLNRLWLVSLAAAIAAIEARQMTTTLSGRTRRSDSTRLPRTPPPTRPRRPVWAARHWLVARPNALARRITLLGERTRGRQVKQADRLSSRIEVLSHPPRIPCGVSDLPSQ